MASITLPTAATINVVATTSDYSAKKNLGTNATGSYLKEATILVYDEILRFQRGRIENGLEMTHDLTPTMIDDFNYDNFEGNVLWFMDELVGTESDWISTASNNETTAYGYVQFTEPSVKTAVTRYEYHIDQFNTRKDNRDWKPYSIEKGEKLEYPEWLTTLKNSTKTHKENLDALTYDQQLALAFVHLHSKESWDYNFVQLAKGDVAAAKTLYTDNHHMAIATVVSLVSTLTYKQKNSIYFAIKRIYEPMYGKGSNSTVLDDETYFNYLKGYVGSFFYKEFPWWNKDDDLSWIEFIGINAGNAVYQLFDIIFERESIKEAFTDLIEQGKGTWDAASNKSDIRDELKGKTTELQIWDEVGSEQLSEGPIVWVGFDEDGDIVVYEKSIGSTKARVGAFFKIHYGW